MVMDDHAVDDLTNDKDLYQLEKKDLKLKVYNSIKYRKRSNVAQLMKATLTLNNSSNRFSQSQRNTPMKVGGPVSKFSSTLVNNQSVIRMKRNDSV